MAISLLPLCSVGKVTTRDGGVGPLANVYLPFSTYGYWYPSGQQYAFPSATIAQSKAINLLATTKPDLFVKTPGVCTAQ